MHMAMVIGNGLLLLVVFLVFGKLWGTAAPAYAAAAKLFVPVWLLVALVNMWIGVTRAGYTVMQELPILLVVFGVPAVAAGVVAWQAARG